MGSRGGHYESHSLGWSGSISRAGAISRSHNLCARQGRPRLHRKRGSVVIMPAYTTLPESMLAPSQIADKFNVQTFAGLGALGCDCAVLDEVGDCTDPECCPG